MKCFYHKNDLDVKCSAAIVRLALTTTAAADHADVDILSIAKSFGGGGHKGACGFQVQVLPFALKAAKPVTRSVS